MTAGKNRQLVSVEDYLAGEWESPVRREYVGGILYAVPGELNRHGLIATNVLVVLGVGLRGRRGRPFGSDTKIRVRLPTHVRFYYPDTSVVCRPNPQTDSFQDEPAVIVEVLSRRTRRIDEGEKKDAYLSIPSLAAFLLVEQELPGVVVFRRTEHGFVRELYDGLDAVVPLPEVEADLPLAEVYDGVEFTPEPDDADGP